MTNNVHVLNKVQMSTKFLNNYCFTFGTRYYIDYWNGASYINRKESKKYIANFKICF